ncbi:hypothetical protein E8E14_002528 [Neopestalotiopsis sp. 37M]|nr:hypothetical protein E8E14_002528 [Neopestalotiopsis sp. 37M]
MATPTPGTGDGVKILHASLYRMGTWSMAKAYRTLGFNTFYALDESMSSMNWVLVEQAAKATWTTVPDAHPRPLPFTRNDWDRLWGNHYDALCDTSGPFTLELIKAYPRAKVVLVQRDYDAWWPSFRAEILDKVFAPGLLIEFLIFLAWHLVGFRGVHAMRRLLLGFFRATTREEIEENGREIYDRFFRQIREAVPPEQLLEYELGCGWEPLYFLQILCAAH